VLVLGAMKKQPKRECGPNPKLRRPERFYIVGLDIILSLFANVLAGHFHKQCQRMSHKLK
jgi:hypothetical protein